MMTLAIALKAFGALFLFGLAMLGRDAARRWLPDGRLKRLLLLRLYRADWERRSTELQRL